MLFFYLKLWKHRYLFEKFSKVGVLARPVPLPQKNNKKLKTKFRPPLTKVLVHHWTIELSFLNISNFRILTGEAMKKIVRIVANN